MKASLIVAVAENGVIGRNGGLPWRLSADLQHFKKTTMGHHLIIGRRTWDEVGKPLPGRSMVVVTRSRDFSADGATVVHSIEEALEVAAGDDEPFIGGGAYIYRLALEKELVDRLYITRVRAVVEGDTFFPEIDLEQWALRSESLTEADEKNEYACSFEVFERKIQENSQF